MQRKVSCLLGMESVPQLLWVSEAVSRVAWSSWRTRGRWWGASQVKRQVSLFRLSFHFLPCLERCRASVLGGGTLTGREGSRERWGLATECGR